jgi:hypothetical protein
MGTQFGCPGKEHTATENIGRWYNCKQILKWKENTVTYKWRSGRKL